MAQAYPMAMGHGLECLCWGAWVMDYATVELRGMWNDIAKLRFYDITRRVYEINAKNKNKKVLWR